MLRSDLPIHRARQIGARDSSMVIFELVSMNSSVHHAWSKHGVWTVIRPEIHFILDGAWLGLGFALGAKREGDRES
jgi:hypothetical protein